MANVQGNLLSVEIVWMPCEEDLEEQKNSLISEKGRVSGKTALKCKSVVSLRKRLSTSFNYARVKFLDIRSKKGCSFEYVESPEEDFYDVTKKTSSFSYSESLYSISCEVGKEKHLLDVSSKSNLVSLFCSCKSGGGIKDGLWMTFFDIAELNDEHRKFGLKPTSATMDFKSFTLGNLVGMNTFVSHFDSTALESHGYRITQVKCRFLHDFQRLEVYFVVGKAKLHVSKRNPETHRLFKVEVSYMSINRILVCNDKHTTIFLHFLYPPLLFGVVQNTEADSYISLINCNCETNWERVLDLFEGSPVELRREFSMNTVLKLDCDSRSDYDFLSQLSNHYNNIEMYFSPVTVVPASQNVQINAISSKNFACYYALKCITSRSFEVYDHITVLGQVKEVNDFLSLKCSENPMLLSEVLYQIYNAFDQGNVVIFSTAVKVLFKKFDFKGGDYDLIYINRSVSPKNSQKTNASKEYNLSKGEIVYIRRAVVMPTHVRFLLLQPMLKSRLLRSCDSDFALRVSVRDVNLNGLSFTVKTASGPNRRDLQVKFVSEHIKGKMLNGIKIGNRKYEYLGGSTSQLRSHGLWFYAKDKQNRSAKQIRDTVGHLEVITLVPKYMARMGQSFSQAIGFVTVSQECTNVKCPEQDILGQIKIYASESENETENETSTENYKRYLSSTFNLGEELCDPEPEDAERYNFTDGIGRMSQEIANLVYEKLELHDEAPSAMQIRYAGCKGMLVVDPRIKGKKIIFRASMRKFDSDSDSLEILKTSYPRLVYLNRPFITILEQMGVEKEVFLKLQKLEIKQLIKSMFYNKDAENVLKISTQLGINYTGLFDSGFSLTEDPFFRSMILAIFRREMTLLKTKARILVPPDMGRTMFGVVDETLSLDYGEIFVQYTDFITKDKTHTKIIQGRVLVTKNPCSHPGDVRIFKAVYVKELEHIRDCIVFPAKGPRPHPDEMAGSDLDGDEYSVVWHPDLMFQRENYPAMHFAFCSEKPKDDNKELKIDLKKPVEVADELDFFCTYIMNSSVGVIANAWLAWADKDKSGIFSRRCFSLAKKYSMALDFAKSGKSVQLGKGEFVFSYPDFMQKLSEKDTYASNRALGYLYRNCKRLELGFEATTSEAKFTLDKDLVYESWEKYKESALNSLKNYSHQIRYSLRTYGIDQEGELLSGALIKVSKLYEDRHDFNDMVNILEYEVKKLFQNLNKEFFAEFEGKPSSNEFSEDMLRKASAWYVVTYTQGQDKLDKETKYFGLPWAVADILIDIKKRNSNQTEEQGKSFLSILTQKASFMETLIDKSLKNRITLVAPSPNYKLLILDTAFDILTKWLKLQENNLVVVDLKFLKECLVRVFDEISSELSCCDDKYFEYLLRSGEKRKLYSPAYYILETLMRIADLGAAEKEDANFDAYQEFGLFAWVTLVRLGCSCSTEPLGIMETAEEIPQGSYVTHNDEIEIIKVPLTADKFLHSKEQAAMVEEFRCDIIHEEKLVKAFLQNQTHLKCIEMRAVEEKGKKYSLRLIVKGSRFAIERLKDLVVLPNFFESVVLGKSRFQKIKMSKSCSQKDQVSSQ